MKERFRALKGLTFAAPACQAMVRKAGGISKLSSDEQAKLKMTRVEPGEVTDQIPEESIGWLLDQRCIERVAQSSAAQTKGVADG